MLIYFLVILLGSARILKMQTRFYYRVFVLFFKLLKNWTGIILPLRDLSKIISPLDYSGIIPPLFTKSICWS